jgi:hypothetical protein
VAVAWSPTKDERRAEFAQPAELSRSASALAEAFCRRIFFPLVLPPARRRGRSSGVPFVSVVQRAEFVRRRWQAVPKLVASRGHFGGVKTTRLDTAVNKATRWATAHFGRFIYATDARLVSPARQATVFNAARVALAHFIGCRSSWWCWWNRFQICAVLA